MLQILEQVQKKHTLVPNSGTRTAKGQEKHLNRSPAVRNGVGMAASEETAPAQSPDDGCENHTRL